MNWWSWSKPFRWSLDRLICYDFVGFVLWGYVLDLVDLVEWARLVFKTRWVWYGLDCFKFGVVGYGYDQIQVTGLGEVSVVGRGGFCWRWDYVANDTYRVNVEVLIASVPSSTRKRESYFTAEFRNYSPFRASSSTIHHLLRILFNKNECKTWLWRFLIDFYTWTNLSRRISNRNTSNLKFRPPVTHQLKCRSNRLSRYRVPMKNHFILRCDLRLLSSFYSARVGRDRLLISQDADTSVFHICTGTKHCFRRSSMYFW